MKLSIVRNPNGTYDFAVGLYAEGERCYYAEYHEEFSPYQEALDYAREKTVEYQQTIQFHGLNIAVVYDCRIHQYDCPNSEKAVPELVAA
ncbi:MAG: hypothetical protein DMG06_30815 [Acidobacteria bacterium]|nr:MAG: hypothetical protein DMG06_30815 [Acidobacteriota bacterium]